MISAYDSLFSMQTDYIRAGLGTAHRGSLNILQFPGVCEGLEAAVVGFFHGVGETAGG